MSEVLILRWLHNRPRFLPRTSAFRDAQARLVVETASLGEELRSERHDREAAGEALQRQLEEFAVGGLQLETVGLMWIFIGIILTTISVEIDKLYKLVVM